jgi:hypothetical protein
MRKLRLLAALCLVSTPVAAQIVTIGSSTLGTMPFGTAHTYTGLDGLGMTMNVTAGAGGLMGSFGPSVPGLWFGLSNQSSSYNFTFSSAIRFVEFSFTAQSTDLMQGVSETFRNFITTSGTRTYSFTNVQGTAWDGTSLTSTVLDGKSVLGISVAAGQSFTGINFEHLVTGGPAGSVISQMRFERAPSTVVPEPQSYLMMAGGLLVLGGIARRRTP